jgi:hypothetical protein
LDTRKTKLPLEGAQEVYMGKSPPPVFPDWLPKAVRLQAKELWEKLPTEKDSAKAQRVLEQLIANPLMERVWDELYRPLRMPKDVVPALWAPRGIRFVNPACLTKASQAVALREKAQALRKEGGERNREDAAFLDFEVSAIASLPDPAPPDWNEQDCAAQVFFTRAYEIALRHEPVIISEGQAKVDKLQDIAERLRELAEELNLMDTIFSRRYAEKLEKVAADCDDDAKIIRPNLTKDPWVVPRRRGDLRRRTIVGKLASTTHELFYKILPSTIANVTNVIQSCENGASKKINRDGVRKLLGPDALRIRPSFGPLIYPMIQARAKKLKSKLGS